MYKVCSHKTNSNLNCNSKNMVIVLEVCCPSVKVAQESGQPQSSEFWGVLQVLLSWEFLMMGELFTF